MENSFNKGKNEITEEIYFVTDTVVEWIDIFTCVRYKEIIIDSLRHCQQQ